MGLPGAGPAGTEAIKQGESQARGESGGFTAGWGHGHGFQSRPAAARQEGEFRGEVATSILAISYQLVEASRQKRLHEAPLLIVVKY
jgi:hypothetical protein